MKSNIDTREELFYKNIEFFRNFHPNIYQKLIHAPETGKFSLVSSDYSYNNKNLSLLNLQIKASGEVAYQSNPIETASKQAQNALSNDSWLSFSNDTNKLTNINKMISISNGLGYNLKEYCNQYSIKSILIIEEDIELFKFSLFVTNYHELSKDKNLIFCIDENDENIKNFVLKFYHELFFYNNSIKLTQFFHNTKMNYVISILQQNLNESVFNRAIDYTKIIDNTINNENFEKLHDEFFHNVFKENQYTKELMLRAINLLSYVNKNINLQINYQSVANHIYCALYYITTVYKEKGYEHIHTNCFQVLVNNANLKTLQEGVYDKILYLYDKAKKLDLQILFLEAQIKQLEHEAINDKNKLDKIKHKIYKLNALKGSNLKIASADYVKKEFDDYADKFETTLVDKLKYNIPSELNDLLQNHIKKNRNYSIVDLGCGTGLLGEKIKNISNELIGIDLSPEMIKQAKDKNIYTNLIESDIDGYLKSEITNGKKYDIFTATDVFVYIGDLEDTFNLTKQSITKDGLFCFSIELLEDTKSPFILNKTGRFSHSKNYIEDLAKKHKFIILEDKKTVIRQEHNKDVIGYIFILKN